MKGLGILLLVAAVLVGVIYGVFAYWCNYVYERDIGGYMANAHDMNTPSRMIEQLEAAKAGMLKAGLRETDYGAMIFTRPDNSMKFQYEHLDSILERVRAVEEWRSATYGHEGTATENLGDVYESKMTNLRKFIVETTRSDWIAENAWFIENHVMVYKPIAWIIFISLCLAAASGIVLLYW